MKNSLENNRLYAVIFMVVLVLILLAVCIAVLEVMSPSAPSAYNVQNIVYTFDPLAPASVAVIAFDLDAPANVVAISLGDKFFLCESTSPFTHWTCPVQGVTAGNTDMRVVVK